MIVQVLISGAKIWVNAAEVGAPFYSIQQHHQLWGPSRLHAAPPGSLTFSHTHGRGCMHLGGAGGMP